MSVLELVAALRSSWTLTLVRPACDSPPLAAVAGVVAAGRALGPTTTFDHAVSAAGQTPIDVSEATLRALVAGNPDPVQRTIMSTLTLATAGESPAALSYQRDPLRDPAEDLVRMTYRAGTVEPAGLWHWLGVAAAAFGAKVAWLDTYALSLFAGERRRRAVEEAEPPDLRSLLPPAPPLILKHPDLAERFARHIGISNRTELPERVGWANAWSGDVITRMGRARVEAASWHHVEPFGDALLLVASADPPDEAHPEALAAVAHIQEQLTWK